MSDACFTFAIIADTHLNPVDGQSGSPWRSNGLANDRSRWAVGALNADKPAFVLHLGDMVHPVPAQQSYPVAAARFENIFGGLTMPLHAIPGNHDIGDKPGDWMPAHTVTPDALATYRQTFGSLWSAFDKQDCRFILHCNPILGSGLPEDDMQWQWLEAQLVEAKGKRIFFLTHYPLFLSEPDEPEHYDNLAFAVRERLRCLLLDHGVEAVFAAHVHTIFHTSLAQEGSRPFQHVVPSLSALRLDYSHMFRTPPAPDQEYGRNDAQKLGYYLVDVLPDGYRIRFRRSDGDILQDGTAQDLPDARKGYLQPISERPIGVDLRHGWAHQIAIPYSGVVDEFRRKYVYNDYLLTGLQETGLRDLRIPIDDVLDTETLSRMGVFAAFGHRFHAFTIDPPDEILTSLLRRSDSVHSIEIIARPELLESRVSEWRDALGESGITLLASRLWSSADLETSAVSFAHQIGHGFQASDLSAIPKGLSDGVVIRIGPEDDPEIVIKSLPQTYAGELVIYLSMTSVNPAISADNDAAQADRIIKTVAAMSRVPNCRLMLDTFEDHDRGYFPRHGLYDGQFNPRQASFALSGLEF